MIDSTNAEEKEYFGEFLDSLKGVFITDAEPRPRFRLESDFRFRDPNGLLWKTPAQKEVDGASIPQPFWSFIGGPFEGKYINASVIHDYYCDAKTRTSHDTHRAFYYGMRASNVSEWKAKFMYWAVATFGPDWILTNRIIFNSVRGPNRGLGAFTQSPRLIQGIEVRPPVDLEDPDVLAAALSKAQSVARSLRTSNGRILDVSIDGDVVASLDRIESISNYYRSEFVAKAILSDPEKLGILTQWKPTNLDDIKPWDNHKLPGLDNALILNLENARAIAEGKHFTLDPAGNSLLQERMKAELFKPDDSY
jgi:hypothetical protein